MVPTKIKPTAYSLFLLMALFFFSVATLVAADYSITCLPRFMYLLLLSVTDKNWNFSAVRNPIELKLGGDLGLVISVQVLVLRLVCLHVVNKQTKNLAEIAKNAVLENLSFLRRAMSNLSETWWGHPGEY
jgi:hypothetical protein